MWRELNRQDAKNAKWKCNSLRPRIESQWKVSLSRAAGSVTVSFRRESLIRPDTNRHNAARIAVTTSSLIKSKSSRKWFGWEITQVH